LLPVLGGLIGPRLVGVLATLAAALLFSTIAYERFGERARLGVIWFRDRDPRSASSPAGSLRPRRGGRALCRASPPQKGHRFPGDPVRRGDPARQPGRRTLPGVWYSRLRDLGAQPQGLELAVVTVGIALLISAASPEGGTEPFAFSSFEPAILVAIARLRRPAAGGGACSATGWRPTWAALAAAFLIQSPMGGNATRRGRCCLVPSSPSGSGAASASRSSCWCRCWSTGSGRPSSETSRRSNAQAVGQRGLLRAARRLPPRAAASRLAACRGAPGGPPLGVRLRPQRDLHRQWAGSASSTASSTRSSTNRPPSPGRRYRSWLDDLGVGYVAVPRAPLDYAALGEKRLIKRGPPRYPRAGLPQHRTGPVYRRSQSFPTGDRGKDGEADNRRGSWLTRARPAPCWSGSTGRRTGRSSRGKTAAWSRRPVATR